MRAPSFGPETDLLRGGSNIPTAKDLVEGGNFRH